MALGAFATLSMSAAFVVAVRAITFIHSILSFPANYKSCHGSYDAYSA